MLALEKAHQAESGLSYCRAPCAVQVLKTKAKFESGVAEVVRSTEPKFHSFP